MAIRFEYQPLVAGAIAGYATGRGRAKSRQTKYSQGLLRDQQRLAGRLGGRLGGQRIEAEKGEWSEDPFKAAVARGDTAEARRIRANRRRGGSQDDESLYSQYTPGRTQKEIERDEERGHAAGLLEKKHKREDKIRAKEWEREDKIAKGKAEDAAQRDIDDELEDEIEDSTRVYTEDGQKAINEVDKDIALVMKDKGGGLTDEDKAEFVAMANEKKREIRRWGTKLQDDPNANLFYRRDGVLYPHHPGMTAPKGFTTGRVNDGVFTPDEPSPQELAEQEAKDEAAADLKVREKLAETRAWDLWKQRDPEEEEPEFGSLQEVEDDIREQMGLPKRDAAPPPGQAPDISVPVDFVAGTQYMDGQIVRMGGKLFKYDETAGGMIPLD